MLVAVAQRGHGHLAGLPGRAEVVAHHLHRGPGQRAGWGAPRRATAAKAAARGNCKQPRKGLTSGTASAHLGFQDRHPGAALPRLGDAHKGIALAKSISVLQLDSGECQLDLQQQTGGREGLQEAVSRPHSTHEPLSAPHARGPQLPTITEVHSPPRLCWAAPPPTALPRSRAVGGGAGRPGGWSASGPGLSAGRTAGSGPPLQGGRR